MSLTHPTEPSADPRCLRCGALAVQRRAGRGPNVGRFFWGCSRFPKCRWTKSIVGIGPTPDPLATPSAGPMAAPAPVTLGGAVIGQPGFSAQAEYDRRAAKDAATRSAAMPDLIFRSVIAGAVVAMILEVVYHANGIGVGAVFGLLYFLGRGGVRRSTAAWSIGARGEERTAAVLDPLADEGFVVMHDLRISMSRANIDHLVIGPTGVFVVETKNIAGNVRLDGQDVRIGGRRVGVVEEVGREVGEVSSALRPLLDEFDVTVQPIVCVHRADLPWFRRTAAGIQFVYPGHLTKEITRRPVVLTSAQIGELRALAEYRLPPRRS